MHALHFWESHGTTEKMRNLNNKHEIELPCIATVRTVGGGAVHKRLCQIEAHAPRILDRPNCDCISPKLRLLVLWYSMR